MKNTEKKELALFLIGGIVYAIIEIAWRGHTHWTMFPMGGALFLIIGGLNEFLPWEMSLPLQAGIGMVAVTAAEFIAGCVLNLWLGLGVWDYSHLTFNLMGQICVPYMGAWLVLSALAIVLDDWLRYWLFHEEKPHYKMI